MIPVPCRPGSGTPDLAVRLAADDAEALAAALAAALARGANMLVFDGAMPPGLRARSGAVRLVLSLDGPDAPLPANAPDAVLLAGARSGRDVAALGARLAVHEAEQGWPDGGVRILAEIGDPLGVLDARSFTGASPRLAGLGLDAGVLAAALGGDATGEALAQARGLVRLAAAAAGVTAFATVGPEGIARAITAARRDGFGLLITRDPGETALAAPC